MLRGGASAVLPVCENGDIILVRQYRHAVKEMMFEIPAGCFEGDESPYDCAARELEEETGFKAGRLTLLTPMYPSAGFVKEIIYLYYAENLTPGIVHLDSDEFIEIIKTPLEKAVKMAFDGELRDSKTLAAIFMYKALKGI